MMIQIIHSNYSFKLFKNTHIHYFAVIQTCLYQLANYLSVKVFVA